MRELDNRSLAIFRIILGCLIFSQAYQLSCDFEAFYGNNNVTGTIRNSSASLLLKYLILGGIPLFATCFVVGLWTRLATFLCFAGIIIVQESNPLVLQGGDALLRLLLFWSVFLPLGSVWSLDSRIKTRISPALPWTTSCASWALILQICSVYWFACALKQDSLWISTGNALFFALNLEHFTTPFGLYLRQYPDLLRVLTFGTIFLEFLGPALLFVPFHRARIRLGLVTTFVGFHLIGMESLLRIGIFPWVCATAWLVFIPGFFWEWLVSVQQMTGQKTKAIPKRPVAPQSIALFSRSRIDQAAACFVVLCSFDVFCWNIASLAGTDAMRWMRNNDLLGMTFRLEQRWNMYAPRPPAEHGWLLVPATLANSSEVDLITGQTVAWTKPNDIGIYFGDDRWRRFLSNFFKVKDPEQLKAYANYLINLWDKQHPNDQKVQVVTIVFMRQLTLPDLSVTPPEKEVLYFQAY